jgi:glycogen debranching enzyme
VREALRVFLHFQGGDGNIVDGYVPKDKASVNYKYRSSPGQPLHLAHKNTVETDQESSLVQAVCRYVRKTGDLAMLDEVVQGRSVRQRLEMALEYPLKHRFSEDHGLIWGATTADWGDVQPEHEWGVELDANSHRAIDIYDNALLLVAIGEFLQTAAGGQAGLQAKWEARRESLRSAVRKHLWDESHRKFIPHVYLEGSPFPDSFDERKVFYHGGTTVAMEADLLDPDEILVSYGQMRANVRLSGAATIGLTLYPPYPAGSFKNPSMRPYSYQNGGDWTWFGARTVRQLARHGHVAEAYQELVPMLERVIRHEGFYEWWTLDNQPKGSGQFRGSAGVLLEAIAELRAWAKAAQQEAE